jgi:fumarate reductase flavoprotein subunit
MKHEKSDELSGTEEATPVSRRSFLAGAAIAATGIAAGGLAGCTAQGTGDVAETPGGTTGGNSTETKTAGTKYTTYSNPDEIGIVHDTAGEETVDVVVIGTGVTGLSCGMLVAEQAPDAKVLLIDKMASPGGNTNFAEINEPGLGMSWEDALAAGLEKSRSKMELIDAYLWANVNYDNGRLSAWFYTKHGVELASDNFYYKGHTGALAIQNLVGQIDSDAAYANVELRLSCQAIALLMSDDHTCTGVQVKDTETGDYTNVKAKAVMLATGGMGNNAELLSYYTGLDVVEKATEIGLGQDGDGHLMVEYTAHGMSKDVDPTSGWVLVKGMELSSALSVAASMQYANVFVNQTGTRFNSEDYSASRGGQDHNFINQGKVFSIMGKGLIDYFQTAGSDHPSFYHYQVPSDLTDALSSAIDNENVFKADSFEELAKLIDVPQDAFINEMNAYDADAKAGTGDSKFSKDVKFMIPFGDGPYYAFRCSSILLQTNNGIRINTDSQVVDPYYVPIVGLYAGGIAVSGFMTCMRELGISQKGGLWGGLKAARAIVVNDRGGTVADNWFGDTEYDGPMPAPPAERERDKPLPGAVQ